MSLDTLEIEFRCRQTAMEQWHKMAVANARIAQLDAIHQLMRTMLVEAVAAPFRALAEEVRLAQRRSE